MKDSMDMQGCTVPLCGNPSVAPAPDPALDRWVLALRRQSRAARAALCLVDGSRQWLRMVSDDAVDVNGELSDGTSLEQRLRGASKAPQDFAAVPVCVEGHVVGQLGICSPWPAAWSTDAHSALEDAAAGVGAELERRSAQADKRRVQQLIASHNDLHEMIGRGAPLREVLKELCETIQRYDPTLRASVLLRNPKANTLHAGAGPSFPQAFLDSVEGAPIGPNIGTCGPAAWFGRFCVSADLGQDPNWAPIRAIAELAGVAHCWSMPVKDIAGEVLGTMALYGSQPREPRPEHVTLLQDSARVAGTAIERARSMKRLEHDARHDSLTGLPNRAAIFERLDAAIQRVAETSATAVLFVDLDGLKAMNDTLGHDVADEMIREVAQRLSRSVRGHDFVGRFGGDEFIVVSERVRDAEEARILGARLLETVSCPLPGLEARVVTASIGITLVRSRDVDAREALRRADGAMYEAKRMGRDRCVFAEAGEQAPAGRRLQLERGLRGAETRGELRLVYQPVIGLPERRIVGVEALLRWTSPELGEVTPAEFIPISEDTGSILQIGAWVLRESCEAIARLAVAGRPLELAVNVSARQLSQPDFPMWVRQTLAHAQFPAALLSLEITETALLRPDGVTMDNLIALQKLGVRVALDDFGTGYSSLAWLRDHPLATIKIDRGFVAGIEERAADRAIVAGIIRMARDLGGTVIAEGVETEGQLTILESLGCDAAQGFYIARPGSVDAFVPVHPASRPGAALVHG